MQRADHITICEEYEKAQSIYENTFKENRQNKRYRLSQSPGSPLLGSVGITSHKSSAIIKYPRNSSIQKLHYDALISILVKCMLPVSIVENQGMIQIVF